MKIRLQSLHGNALLATLSITAILGIILTAYLKLASANNTSIARGQAWNLAIPIAEAGIEDALMHLNFTNGLASDGWTMGEDGHTVSRQQILGTNQYRANIYMPSSGWPYIISTGYARSFPSGSFVTRTVKVTTKTDGFAFLGLVALGRIDLKGNNILSDSFDSMDPSKSTGGKYDANKAQDKGDVATNLDVTNSISIANANIYGHVYTGPGGTISIGPNGAVGSHSWQQSHSGFQEGWTNDDMNIYFPPVAAPFAGGWTPSSGEVNGDSFDYVLGKENNYYATSLSMSGKSKLIVTNSTVLFVDGSISMSGQAQIIVTNGATFKIYANGSASLNGNGVMNYSGNATNFMFFGMPGCTSASLTGNGTFTGVLYAPNADLSMNGGGKSDEDFAGASVSKTVTMNGHFNFHYDENLGRQPNSGIYQVTSWTEL